MQVEQLAPSALGFSAGQIAGRRSRPPHSAEASGQKAADGPRPYHLLISSTKTDRGAPGKWPVRSMNPLSA